MAEVILVFDSNQQVLPIHHSKIKKSAIEASVRRKWKLDPEHYHLSFEDLDGDIIQAKLDSDYDFARENIMKEKQLKFILQIKAPFISMFRHIANQNMKQKDEKNPSKAGSEKVIETDQAEKTVKGFKKEAPSKQSSKKSQGKKNGKDSAQKNMKSKIQFVLGENLSEISKINDSSDLQTRVSDYEKKVKGKIKIPCQVCAGKLTVPYYFDPYDEIYLCQVCEGKYEEPTPLIKIKEKGYAEKTAFTYFHSVNHDELEQKVDQPGTDKYLAEIKEFFIKDIRTLFNQKIDYERKIQKEEKKVASQTKKGTRTKESGLKSAKIVAVFEYDD